MRRSPLTFALGGLVVAAVSDAWFLGAAQHGEFWWSHLYGFFALLGFLGALAIIVFAKALLGPWLQRNENYYKGT